MAGHAEADEGLVALLAQPLIPLSAQHRSARIAKQLVECFARQAEGGLDAHWAWVAGQMRWTKPWTAVRQGEWPDARYFVGGELNVCDNCVDRHAETAARADKAAVIWEGEPGDTRTLSYRELRDASARFAGALRALGVAQGDVVALFLPNLPETFVAIHACNRIGAIYTVLFSGFSPEAVALRLSTARAKVVITADVSWRRGRKVALLESLRVAVPQAPALEHVIVVNRSGEAPELLDCELDFETLVAEAQPVDCVPLEANAPSFLVFTSGTESKPKGLVHSTAGFLIGSWANVNWQVGIEDDDVYWCATDVGWLTFPIQAPIGTLSHGGTVLCFEGALDAPTRMRFYDICERHRVTKVLAAPTALRMLRALGEEAGARSRIPGLRLVTAQGEPLDIETYKWVRANMGDEMPLVNAYGQTETGCTWTHPVFGVDDQKPGSCGRPVPGFACEVVDDAGSPVPAGVKGNLVITQPFPSLARTVWDDHARYLSSYFARFPGRYATSDEACVDEDGHIWVLGRADDVINVAAHRISTMEVESVVAAQAGVADAAVVGVADQLKGMVPVAFVVLRTGTAADDVERRVRAAVEHSIGGIARLQRVYVCPGLPKTRAGKTMRRLLRAIVETGAARGDLTGLEDASVLEGVLAAVAAPASKASA